MDEIEALYLQGVRLFLFDDEQFLPIFKDRRDWMSEWQKALERGKLTFAFTIKCRPDDVEPELFAQLQQSGLVRVYLGLESGCQATLDRIGKRLNPERSLQALADLRRLGIVSDFRSLLFHPWSTVDTIQEDIEYLTTALDLVPTCLDFREVQVYPGTPLASRLPAPRHLCRDTWNYMYICSDPRVELLRRLYRIIFCHQGSYFRLRERLTSDWFGRSLQDRFWDNTINAPESVELRSVAQGINRVCLKVWRDMLAFVEDLDGFDDEAYASAASSWRQEVDIESFQSLNNLAKLCHVHRPGPSSS
jgi:radical SAM superfamily enzyme YgiQ (UPF0313 family)